MVCWEYHLIPRKSLCKAKTFSFKMAIFVYTGSDLVLRKNFGQFHMERFYISENLIAKGILEQIFKVIAQETTSAEPFIFESVRKMVYSAIIYSQNIPSGKLITWVIKNFLLEKANIIRRTRKATGFKYLRVNCLEINQGTSECQTHFSDKTRKKRSKTKKLKITVKFYIFEIV